MKKRLVIKLISALLVLVTLTVSLPITVFADAAETRQPRVLYKSIKFAQANTKEQAKSLIRVR